MKHLLASAALIAAFAAPVAAQDADTVLATVNGKDITLGHLIAVVDTLPPQFQQLPDEQLYSGLLEQLIRQEALASGVRDDLGRALRLALETQETALIANSVVDEAQNVDVTEDDLRAAYETSFGNAAPKPEFNASHILVDTEAEAASLVTQLAEGADFTELAKTFSTGPSGPNGGALGWFGLGQMVPPFEAAVLELEVGEVSAPVETQFGWHVLILNDQREVGGPTFDEVRSQLVDQIAQDRVSATVDGAMAAATIARSEAAIDPALIRNTDLIAD
jgi:peptidyl-prolyl cis-trans isomerase C